MHKWKPNELGKAACFFLQVAGGHHVFGPTVGVFHAAKHDGDVGTKTNTVCHTMTFEPLFGVYFVGAQDGANFVVEYFGCCTR